MSLSMCDVCDLMFIFGGEITVVITHSLSVAFSTTREMLARLPHTLSGKFRNNLSLLGLRLACQNMSDWHSNKLSSLPEESRPPKENSIFHRQSEANEVVF
jgi:hypothetical protein